MLFQQSAELGVLRPQGSLCIAHMVMIADRPDTRQAVGGIPAPEGERQAGTVQDQLTPRGPLTWARSEDSNPSL